MGKRERRGGERCPRSCNNLLTTIERGRFGNKLMSFFLLLLLLFFLSFSLIRNTRNATLLRSDFSIREIFSYNDVIREKYKVGLPLFLTKN